MKKSKTRIGKTERNNIAFQDSKQICRGLLQEDKGVITPYAPRLGRLIE